MQRLEIFSGRARLSAVATGVASGLALFPVLMLQYPFLLIVGGIIQPRFPSVGRWFIWIGAIELWVMLITYDVILLRPGQASEYMAASFSASTILLAWCSVELIADGANRLRARRAMPRAKPQRVGWGLWTVAAVFNLWAAWIACGLFLWYMQPGAPHPREDGFYPFLAPIVTVLIIIVFDAWLARRITAMRYLQASDPTPS